MSDDTEPQTAICSFCHRPSDELDGIVLAADAAAICEECVDVALEIIKRNREYDRQVRALAVDARLRGYRPGART